MIVEATDRIPQYLVPKKKIGSRITTHRFDPSTRFIRRGRERFRMLSPVAPPTME